MTTDHASLPLAVSPARRQRLPASRLIAAAGVAAIAAVLLAALGSGRLLTLGVIGLLLGLALYHSAFGFSHGWRVMLAKGAPPMCGRRCSCSPSRWCCSCR